MESPLVRPAKEQIVTPKDVEIMELLPVETPVTSTSSQIHRAAKDGNVNLLNACLEANPKSFNLLDDKEMSPIHYASQCNRREVIEKLLDGGADVNIRGKDNITPLHVASRFNSIDALKVLLSSNADLSLPCTSNGSTPFLTATRMGNTEVMKVLLGKNPRLVEDSDLKGLTALHWASLRGCEQMCELLLNNEASIGKRTKDGSTPLSFAAESENRKILPMLLARAEKQNLDMNELVNGYNSDVTTPLLSAILAGNVDGVKLLLDKGASVTTTKINGSTPLHMASTNGEDKVVRLLIEKGANVDSRDAEGRTPLHRAAIIGCFQVIRVLVDNKAHLEDKDNDGRTPLLCAISTGQFFAVKLLVNLGADITARDNDLHTGLHLSAIDQQFMILNMLLKSRRSTTQWSADFLERIPLHYAATGEDIKILSTLVESGSNCCFKDWHLATPLHLAAEKGSQEHVELLLKAAPSALHEHDINGFTPLHLAASNKKWEVCDVLLKFGAQVDALDSNLQTPLFQASLSGSPPIIKLLLNYHANIDHTDVNGNTALHIAAQSGNGTIIKTFLDKGTLHVLNNSQESCLDVAIASRSTDAVNTIVKHERWQEFLHVDRGGCRLMSKLITDFPDAVTTIMDNCIKRSHHKPTDPDFCLTFDFQLLDPGPERLYLSEDLQLKDVNPVVKTKQPVEKRFYGLMEMVEHKRKELLVHPLASKLRRIKWRKFGVLVYGINFILHAAFAGLLTHFILNIRGQIKKSRQHSQGGCSSQGVSKMQEGVASIILVVVIIHVLKEIFQMLSQRLRYFTDLWNLFEIVMYVFTLIFIIPYAFRGTDVCTNRRATIWNFGVTAVFMAYFDLILITRTISFLGLYVTMFIEVFKTLLKVMTMCLLFLFAFSIVFYIVFREQDAFDSFFETVVKTMVMTVGELDYMALLVDNEGKTTTKGAPLVPYPDLSYIFIFFFVMTMPIVLMNLLVGLAVGDITAIQNHAFLSRIGRHVEFLTDIENTYPRFLTRLLYSPVYVVYPARINGPIARWWNLFGKSVEKLMLEDPDRDRSESTDLEDERYRDLKDELHDVKDKIKSLTQLMEMQNHRLKSTITSSLPSIAEGLRSSVSISDEHESSAL